MIKLTCTPYTSHAQKVQLSILNAMNYIAVDICSDFFPLVSLNWCQEFLSWGSKSSVMKHLSPEKGSMWICILSNL